MSDDSYSPLLKELAESKPGNQRGQMVRYASRLGGDKAVPWLASALHDPDRFVRGNVTWALAETGSRRAVPILIELLLSSDEIMPQAAESALAQLTHRAITPQKRVSESPVEAHRRWLGWWLSHSDAPVYGPTQCGELESLQ